MSTSFFSIGLTEGTIGNLTIPSISDSLFKLGAIHSNTVAVSVQPYAGNILDGELSWGGIDSSKYIGDITYLPHSTNPSVASFWSFDATVDYGVTTLVTSGSGFVDTGSTLLYLSSKAFNIYKTATGATHDNNTGLLTVDSVQFGEIQSLSFIVADGTTFTLCPDAQLWPRSLNTAIGGLAGHYYLIVGDSGDSAADFDIGLVVLERYYSVFDKTTKRVGLAKTDYTNAIINVNQEF